ncbi:hypothetical protein BN874_2750004 [Candidatus Contendobacter odensis Run_B_J11]|uniref:Uncharacterized protein n=1 Tax=Candidatus Contendobacter odensis Run_B_J11 TaxID=1400861 RepID=A0A7U7GC29_9GAMM|nr:hypothetical protein BN874_2750004 [Candidatus Contendobacter odensis Run_B_J11]
MAGIVKKRASYFQSPAPVGVSRTGLESALVILINDPMITVALLKDDLKIKRKESQNVIG